ncbi:MAG: hypothetical protein JO324_04010 [Candidatus Eremiobacteraeota bacterium]|nr:hypothetical protein [Candidatus Eremiobacteraeota bacterium]
MRALFVTNGHGETAIAQRLADEVLAIAADAQLDHLALVGNLPSRAMRDVGPRAEMPSGGLIAMGNLQNIAKDVRAGLASLTWRQAGYLRGTRGRYDVAVAVGDAYALFMTLLTAAPSIFVGTAKSVAVAGYGPFESLILRRARACFARDEATAAALRRRGVNAEAANAIADLIEPAERGARPLRSGAPALALLPGSRESAYADAAFLLEIVARVAESHPQLKAALSIAPGLDARVFSRDAQQHGWQVAMTPDELLPFVLSRQGRQLVGAWRGSLAALLRDATLVLGQAGTANEVAAAAGVPIIAFEEADRRSGRWYRKRQRGLLGDALAVYPRSLESARAVADLLGDAERLRRMSEAGKRRLGPPGGAARIAKRIVAASVT